MPTKEDGLKPVSEKDLETCLAHLRLPRAWPDNDASFRQEVRLRLGRIERLLDAIHQRSREQDTGAAWCTPVHRSDGGPS